MNHRTTCDTQRSPSPPAVVTAPAQLAELVEELLAQRAVAVDTESDSLFAYRERVCLLQLSTRQADYIVDPLAELDLSPLADLFASSKIQKVFHAAEYDVICLKRDFGFSFANLFDTMWAARILGWPRFGLGHVLKATFGVHTNKRYQRHNWGKRPLDPEALTYACLDTHYLLPLCDLQTKALRYEQRWEEAQEVFEQVAATEPTRRAFDPQGFWRIKGASDLTRREQAILRELYIWRDKEARRRDRPPFKVLTDRALVELAQTRPRSQAHLPRVNGLKRHHAMRYGKRILRAIRSGEQASPPEHPPPSPRHSRAEVERFEALRAWRKEMAAQRGVEPDVVVSNSVLWAVAEQNPTSLSDLSHIEGLGPWKHKAHGARMLRLLAQHRS